MFTERVFGDSGTAEENAGATAPSIIRQILHRIECLLLCSVVSAAAFWVQPVQAEGIYKCRTGDGLLYTDEPVSDSCRRIQVKVTKPDPEAIARLEKWKEQRAMEEAREAAEAREERLVRVRELEALAAWQSARTAQVEAQAAEYCQQYDPQSVYFPSRTYPLRSFIPYGYSTFGGYPFSYGPYATGYFRHGMPPIQLHFSRKRR
ncbi:hypothetical protein [Methylocaldum sp.]|uniref:hypothetical protein n=1 Tax=Methylocaldum sp. TaxID=1969727 RepID=UPI002D2852B8|nr:hypothetical protein [Methylocaldum sp.]HYE33870.1 hypothetical protein [Methylocaldum sp.]